MTNGFRFCISATFTAEPLERVIQFWARELETEFEPRFAPYHQVLQTLLDPASDFASNRRGLNVVLVRPEDIGQNEAIFAEYVEAARQSKFHVPLLFVVCPQVQNEFVLQIPPSASGISYLFWNDPKPRWYNPEGDRLGKIAYSDEGFAGIGTAIVRHAYAISAAPYKVIAVDCDNTLWKGVCGEDGPAGVVLDEPRRFLQQFLLSQREQGMLLSIVSKNNQTDVRETFARHPEFPLRLEHFIDCRINWNPKPENLAAIARSLNLGLDSFIFLDDDARECAEVREELPEVLTLALPPDNEIPSFLRKVWAFDHPAVTDEDRKRSESYQQAQQFGSAIRGAVSMEEFFRSLQLNVTMQPLSAEKLARVAQLTNRTNQFNFTTIRRTEAEVQATLRDGLEWYTADVSDRFGHYGLTGVLALRQHSGDLEVETFLLSCRVLGRGVEYRILRWVGDLALSRKLPEVRIPITATEKNAPARDFLNKVIAESGASGPNFQAEFLSRLVPRAELPIAASDPPEARSTAQRRVVDFARIANELSSEEAIVAKLRGQAISGERGFLANPPATDIEVRLAAIWSELLARPGVSLDDNFFDLGGHSLLAVLLLVRIKEEFGIEIAIDDVYSADMTLDKLARLVEAHQLEASDPAQYAALLQEIEGMSDAEVLEMLAHEEAASRQLHRGSEG